VNLEDLVCFRCISLKYIPKELINLKTLDCSDCPLLSYIPKELTNLKELDCCDCPLLKKIPKELVNLRYLRCPICPLLIHTGIPSTLVNLKDIDYDCDIISIPKHICKPKIETNYHNYRKEGCKKLVSTIFEELIAKTWEPIRAREWCWDEDEKKFMNGMLI
jgi:hypothetical protein